MTSQCERCIHGMINFWEKPWCDVYETEYPEMFADFPCHDFWPHPGLEENDTN